MFEKIEDENKRGANHLYQQPERYKNPELEYYSLMKWNYELMIDVFNRFLNGEDSEDVINSIRNSDWYQLPEVGSNLINAVQLIHHKDIGVIENLLVKYGELLQDFTDKFYQAKGLSDRDFEMRKLLEFFERDGARKEALIMACEVEGCCGWHLTSEHGKYVGSNMEEYRLKIQERTILDYDWGTEVIEEKSVNNVLIRVTNLGDDLQLSDRSIHMTPYQTAKHYDEFWTFITMNSFLDNDWTENLDLKRSFYDDEKKEYRLDVLSRGRGERMEVWVTGRESCTLGLIYQISDVLRKDERFVIKEYVSDQQATELYDLSEWEWDSRPDNLTDEENKFLDSWIRAEIFDTNGHLLVQLARDTEFYHDRFKIDRNQEYDPTLMKDLYNYLLQGIYLNSRSIDFQEHIILEMLEQTKDKPERCVPIYNLYGKLIWPRLKE